MQTRRAIEKQIFKYMLRATRLGDKIDEAFEGDPFDGRLPPDHRKNIRRFRMYVAMQREAFALFELAYEMYSRVSGVGPDEWLEEEIGARQSAAQESGGDIPPGYHVAGYAPNQVLVQRDQPGEQPNAPSPDQATSGEAGSASRRGGRLQ